MSGLSGGYELSTLQMRNARALLQDLCTDINVCWSNINEPGVVKVILDGMSRRIWQSRIPINLQNDLYEMLLDQTKNVPIRFLNTVQLLESVVLSNKL